MKTSRFNKWAAVLLAVLLLVLVPIAALADAGDFGGDVDFGGDFDFDFDSGSDWDSGSDSDFSFIPIIGGGGGSGWVFVVIVVIVLYIILKNRKGGSGKGGGSGSAGPRPQGAKRTTQDPNAKAEGLRRLKAKDPGFSEEALLSRVSNMYVQLQNAWQDKKWEPIRIMMADALYHQFARQLDAYIQGRRTNHVERISVLSAETAAVSEDAVNDIITVLLKTRIVDYVTSDDTGELLSGSRTAEKFMTYEWTMIRAKDVTTEAVGEDGAVNHSNCPNCGAPIAINQSGKCEYCGSVLTAGKYDWIISSIRPFPR